MKSKPVSRKENVDKIQTNLNMAIRNEKGQNGTTKKPPRSNSNG